MMRSMCKYRSIIVCRSLHSKLSSQLLDGCAVKCVGRTTENEFRQCSSSSMDGVESKTEPVLRYEDLMEEVSRLKNTISTLLKAIQSYDEMVNELISSQRKAMDYVSYGPASCTEAGYCTVFEENVRDAEIMADDANEKAAAFLKEIKETVLSKIDLPSQDK